MKINDIRNRSIWVSWEKHTRSRSISSEMNIPLLEISISGRSIYRYIKSIFLTFKAIRKKNIDFIFFQNPSIILSVFLVFFNFIYRRKLIMDAHNAGVYPLEGSSRLLNFIASWVVSKVDITIITNQALSVEVRKMGGNPFVLTDPIPVFQKFNKSTREKKNIHEVVLICTWAPDEPYQEVIESAKHLTGNSVLVKITGRPPKSIWKQVIPKNVSLEGFLSESDYQSLLINSDLVLDLTTRNDCLVCGAYESIAAGTPCIISSTAVNREVFSEGFIFTENDARSIAAAISSGLNRKNELTIGINQFHQKYSQIIRQKIDELAARLC